MTTFRALANPAFVAVTETVTLSPWTSASFDTVCCCVQREKESEKSRRRRQREVTRIIGGSQKEASTFQKRLCEFDRGTDESSIGKKNVLNHHQRLSKHQSLLFCAPVATKCARFPKRTRRTR